VCCGAAHVRIEQGGEIVKPAFCIIKSSPSYECITLHFWKNLAKENDFLNLIWLKVAFIAWHIVFF
jgi:hypothetical protein